MSKKSIFVVTVHPSAPVNPPVRRRCANAYDGNTSKDQGDLFHKGPLAELPRLVAMDRVGLEPSGLAWIPDAKLAIGVSDEINSHSLFVFNPDHPQEGLHGQELAAYPVPLKCDAWVKGTGGETDRCTDPDDLVPLNDMEGITRLGNGDYLIIASQGVEEGEPLNAFYRIRLKQGNYPCEPVRAEVVCDIPLDLDELKSLVKGLYKSDRDCPLVINVEGIASAPLDDDSDLVLLGLREPGVQDKVLLVQYELSACKLKLLKDNPLLLKLDDFPDIKGEVPGIRDIAWIPKSKIKKEGDSKKDTNKDKYPDPEFLMTIGGSLSGWKHPFQIGYWHSKSDQVVRVQKEIPKGFRAEGITITSAADTESLEALLVSDKCALVTELKDIQIPRRSTG